jgi:hypothetical protein
VGKLHIADRADAGKQFAKLVLSDARSQVPDIE